MVRGLKRQISKLYGVYVTNIKALIRCAVTAPYMQYTDDCNVKICKFTALSSGSFCQISRVTDEALIAETAVWPNFFLMNVFFALKGS